MKTNKKRIATYLKLGILLFGISVLLWNCEKDEVVVQEKTNQQKLRYISSISANKVIGLTERLNKASKKITRRIGRSVEDLELDLERIIYVTDSLGLESYTITIKNSRFGTIERLLLTKQDDGEYISSIYQYIPNSSWFKSDGKIKSITSFSGEVIKYNENGQEIGRATLSQGVQIIDNSNSSSRTSSCECSLQVFYVDEEGNQYDSLGSDDMAECYTQVFEWDCSRCGGGSSNNNDPGDSQNDPDPDNNTGGVNGGTGSGGNNSNNNNDNGSESNDNVGVSLTPEEIALAEINNCMSNHGGLTPVLGMYLSEQSQNLHSSLVFDIKNFITTNGCSNETTSFIREAIKALKDGGEVDFEDKIINELTGKSLCVYNKLKSSSVGFKNMIKKFDGDFPVSHLMLTINNNLGSNTYGETQPPVNYVTEIQINENKFSNLSDLGKALVFAHEIIHAEIYRKMLSAAKRGDLNTSTMTAQQAENYVNSLKDNFPGIYDYYVERWHPTWNHNLMASHYITNIADIIEEFDDNRLPRSTYGSIAWVGLGELENNQSTVAWDNLNTNEKQIIENLINQNFFNGPSNCN